MNPAAAAPEGGNGSATYTGNSSNLTGSYTPFSSGSRACLGQVSTAWVRLRVYGLGSRLVEG
jgi:cytochrome P450